LYRIITYEKILGVGQASILNAFRYWSKIWDQMQTIFVEEAAAKKEVRIEVLYRGVF